MKAHPFALIHPDACVASDVQVGAFSIIEAGATIGAGCVLGPRVSVKEGTTLGENNVVFEGAVLGGPPQHLKAPSVVGTIEVGANNTIREFCTIHRGLSEGNVTRIGDSNLLMCGVHVAHDCIVGNNTIFANGAMIGGFVQVEDRAYLSGNVAVHQFCRIGRNAIVGAAGRVLKDVPPYVTVDGQTGHVVGLNSIGLRRSGFTSSQIADLKAAYRVIYRSGKKWSEILEELAKNFGTGPAAEFSRFLGREGRGIVQERRMPPGATIKLPDVAQSGEAPPYRAAG